MLLSCVDFLQKHFDLPLSKIVTNFWPIRKKDIPKNLFNPANDYKSKSYILYDSDFKTVYVAFKSTRGFFYFKSINPLVYDSSISFNEGVYGL